MSPSRGQGRGGGKRRQPPGRGRGGQAPARRGQTTGHGQPARRPGQRGQALAPRRSDDLGGEQVEGFNAVRELLVGDRRVDEVLLLDDHGSPQLAELADLAADRNVAVHRVSARRLEGVARTAAPQGVVARAARLRPVDLDELVAAPTPAGGPPLLVAVDGVTDPGNLGAILRSVEVLGFGGAVLPRHRAVRITPAAAKAAAGAIEHLPIALVGGIPAALGKLGELGLWVIGLDAGASRSFDDLAVAAEGVVLVVGSEGRGLGRLVRQRCDDVVSIPQAGRTESLNVAAATAVAAHEIVRRRRELGGGPERPVA